MSIETIQNNLSERFAAPLPEFYKRRIIFWQDEDKKFEMLIDELSLDNVNIVRLTGSNNFSVKKLLAADDLVNNYLVYNPISYDCEHIQDDWFLDIELYSEEFRADFLSMQMNELNIEPTPPMRKTVKLYSKFLENKERRAKLRSIGREYTTPLQLHIDIMAVLCNMKGGPAQDVIIAVLSNGPDKETNECLVNIRKFGNIDAFWQMVQKFTGYENGGDKPLGFLSSHILLTALSQTMGISILKGLEQFISDSNKAYCYSLFHEWYGSENNSALFDICRQVENQLQIAGRFEKAEIETLLTSSIFPCVNECILKRFFEEIREQVIKVDLIIRTTENRRTAAWFDRTADYFDCLYYIARMQRFYQEHTAGFHIVEPKNIWKFYSSSGYQMDTYYRGFHYAFGNTLKNSNYVLEDSLKHDLDYVEGLYQNWFLKGLTASWTHAIADDLGSLGFVSEIARQRDFYKKYVLPAAGKGSRVFVIISDALRYEVAAELTEILNRNTNGKSALSAMQAVFPAVTKFGMAALLPHTKLSVNEEMDVLADDNPTRSAIMREKVIVTANKNSVTIQYKDLLKMKKQKRREFTAGKEIIYIYHDVIDTIGHKAQTETKVFEACDTAMQEISNTVRMIVNELSGTNIFITADHGFLYTYNPLEESQKISKSTFNGNLYELGRRYALTDTNTTAEHLLPISLKNEIGGVDIKGYAPQDTVRIKTSGGENYVHGGITLQEMIIPVITYKNLRVNSKKFVEVKNAELKLLSESRKVSNLIFSLDLFQKEPLGGKIQPCTYNLYFTDDEGVPVSDRQVVITDKTAINANERVFHVRFNLKSVAFDKNKIYRFVIANDTDVPEELEFHIDIPFTDDSGFDL